MRDLIFSTTIVWSISHSKKNWARYDKNVFWSSCIVTFISVRFWRNLNFTDRSSKNTHMSNSMKIRLVGADLFHQDGRTGRQIDKYDEANSRFSQFCERS